MVISLSAGRRSDLSVMPFYATVFLLVYVLLDYFQHICLNTSKKFFPESDLLKWGASYLPVRPICRQMR